ncbi:MAG: hypothetical protein WD894_01870 [Pirellulales bacterium]
MSPLLGLLDEETALAEGLEEAIEEDLGLVFFVTRHVVARPLDEGGNLCEGTWRVGGAANEAPYT